MTNTHDEYDHTRKIYRSFFFVIGTLVSISLRTLFDVVVMPVEYLLVTFLTVFVLNPLITRVNIIPATHPKTKKRVRIGLEQYLVFPSHMRFDERAVSRFRAIERLIFVIFILFSDPILSGVFQTSGFVIQACLIPVFFAIRASFEYVFQVPQGPMYISNVHSQRTTGTQQIT